MKKSDLKTGLIISWIGWAIFTVWVIAKMTGLINTPLWLTYLPYFTGSLVIAGLLVSLGKYLEKFDSLLKRVSGLERAVSRNTSEIINLKAKLS